MFLGSQNDSTCSLKKYFSKIELCLFFFFFYPPPPPPPVCQKGTIFPGFFWHPSLIILFLLDVIYRIELDKLQMVQIPYFFIHSDASSCSKIGGAYFLDVAGSIQDLIAVPGLCEVIEFQKLGGSFHHQKFFLCPTQTTLGQGVPNCKKSKFQGGDLPKLAIIPN